VNIAAKPDDGILEAVAEQFSRNDGADQQRKQRPDIERHDDRQVEDAAKVRRHHRFEQQAGRGEIVDEPHQRVDSPLRVGLEAHG